jgi:transcriptional regulator with XRE-family HTH domain
VSITPAECKAARKLLGWSQPKLAEMLFVAATVIGEFERRERLSPSLNFRKLRAIFEAAGVEFTNGGEPGIKLKTKAAVTRATWGPPPKRLAARGMKLRKGR